LSNPQWVGEDVDLSRPSVSRVYDYYLGGFHNFASDRSMAEQAIADWPDLPLIMRSNRAFLRRGVSHLIGLGVRQFLDIGSGIPTAGNVHEVAQALAPQARVLYVDTDPVAVAHSRALLADNRAAAILAGDFTRPDDLLPAVHELGLLDPRQPVAVLLNALLHFVPDDQEPAALVARYRDWSAPGSYLMLSHATHELHPAELTAAHRNLYSSTTSRMTMRSREQVGQFFAGYDLLEPGIELSERWRPDGSGSVDDAERFPIWTGLGRKP